jgi:propanol-preferring alcohol dehydrogenase
MRGDLGQRPEDLPRIPGHEIIGTVTETGPDVAGLRPGDRVMSYFYLMCGRCDFCRTSREPLCRYLKGNVGVTRDGGYAEYVTLPAINFLPLPAGIDPVVATAIPDAIATPFHVCGRAAISSGDVVMVLGAGGGVGIHMVQMARLFGADVIGIDVGPRKLKEIRDAGASMACDFHAPGLIERIRSTGSPDISVAVDFVGRPQTLDFCLQVLGRRGRLVLLTTFPGVVTEVSPARMVSDEISIIGSRYASRREVMQAATLVAEKRIRPVVSEVVPLARVDELHEQLRAGTLIGRGAVAVAES